MNTLGTMKSYADSGRQADFRVTYKRLPARQRLFQHMRSNVHWVGDSNPTQQWSIWPEFELPDRSVLPDGEEPRDDGTATLWVLSDEPACRAELRQWLRVGQEGFFMAGTERIAHFTVLELLGSEAGGQPIALADGLRSPPSPYERS
jgi:hypothetical protein